MQNQTAVNSLFRSARNHAARGAILLCAGLLFPLSAQSGDTQPKQNQLTEPAKPSDTPPPYPDSRNDDLETYERKRSEFLEWFSENAKNVNSILVKVNPELEGKPRKLISRAKAEEISRLAGLRMKPVSLGGIDGWQQLEFSERMSEKNAGSICEKVKKHPDVLACDVNGAVFPMGATMNDAFYPAQWYL